MSDVPTFLTLAQAAAYLSVRPKLLRDNWRKWGIPASKVGRELRFEQAELAAWVKSQAA